MKQNVADFEFADSSVSNENIFKSEGAIALPKLAFRNFARQFLYARSDAFEKIYQCDLLFARSFAC